MASRIDIGTTGVVLVAAQGRAVELDAYNANTDSHAVLKLYDKAEAPTTSDTPIHRILLPAGGGAHKSFAKGLHFKEGLGARVTIGVADNDVAPPTADTIIVNVYS